MLVEGSTTVIAPPGQHSQGPAGQEPDAWGPVLVNPTGTSWLASAGTGDVLAELPEAVRRVREPH